MGDVWEWLSNGDGKHQWARFTKNVGGLIQFGGGGGGEKKEGADGDLDGISRGLAEKNAHCDNSFSYLRSSMVVEDPGKRGGPRQQK